MLTGLNDGRRECEGRGKEGEKNGKEGRMLRNGLNKLMEQRLRKTGTTRKKLYETG